MPTGVDACDCRQGLNGDCKILDWKLTLRKTLATSGNQICVSIAPGFSIRRDSGDLLHNSSSVLFYDFLSFSVLWPQESRLQPIHIERSVVLREATLSPGGQHATLWGQGHWACSQGEEPHNGDELSGGVGGGDGGHGQEGVGAGLRGGNARHGMRGTHRGAAEKSALLPASPGARGTQLSVYDRIQSLAVWLIGGWFKFPLNGGSHCPNEQRVPHKLTEKKNHSPSEQRQSLSNWKEGVAVQVNRGSLSNWTEGVTLQLNGGGGGVTLQLKREKSSPAELIKTLFYWTDQDTLLLSRWESLSNWRGSHSPTDQTMSLT